MTSGCKKIDCNKHTLEITFFLMLIVSPYFLSETDKGSQSSLCISIPWNLTPPQHYMASYGYTL